MNIFYFSLVKTTSILEFKAFIYNNMKSDSELGSAKISLLDTLKQNNGTRESPYFTGKPIMGLRRGHIRVNSGKSRNCKLGNLNLLRNWSCLNGMVLCNFEGSVE